MVPGAVQTRCHVDTELSIKLFPPLATEAPPGQALSAALLLQHLAGGAQPGSTPGPARGTRQCRCSLEVVGRLADPRAFSSLASHYRWERRQMLHLHSLWEGEEGRRGGVVGAYAVFYLC